MACRPDEMSDSTPSLPDKDSLRGDTVKVAELKGSCMASGAKATARLPWPLRSSATSPSSGLMTDSPNLQPASDSQTKGRRSDEGGVRR